MRKKKLLIFTLAGLLILSICATKVYAEEDTGESAVRDEQDERTSEPQEGLVYEVKKGDCLWKIAKKFLGDGARYTDIVAWNNDLIQDPGLIYPGMKLQIILDSYVPSVIDGKTWKSEWLGMQLELPDSFEFREEDEYSEEMNVSDEENDLSDDSDGYGITEFFAVNPSALYSVALFGIEQTDCSIEEYVETLNSTFEGLLGDEFGGVYGDGYEWGKKGTEKIGGRSFEHYFAKNEFKEVYMYFAICLDYYLTRIDDKIVVLFTAYIDMDDETDALLGGYAEHGMDELLDGFSAYSGDLTQNDEEASEQDGDNLHADGTQHTAPDKDALVLTETMHFWEKDGLDLGTTVSKNEYDESGNRIRHTQYNDDGDVTQWYAYEYDEKGNVTAETFAVEYMEVWETDIYKDGELLESVHDDRGRPGHGGETRIYKWTHEYDEHDNLIQTVYESAKGEEKVTLYEYGYDDEGNVIRATTYSTDADGRKDKVTEYVIFSYDGENRQVEGVTYDADGTEQSRSTMEYTFDDEGNMTTTICTEGGAVMWFTENREGIMLKSGYQSSPGDDADFTSLQEYDKQGNPSKTTDYNRVSDTTYYTTWEYEYMMLP